MNISTVTNSNPAIRQSSQGVVTELDRLRYVTSIHVFSVFFFAASSVAFAGAAGPSLGWELVTDEIAKHAEGFNRYPPNDGSPELKQAIARPTQAFPGF